MTGCYIAIVANAIGICPALADLSGIDLSIASNINHKCCFEIYIQNLGQLMIL